MLRPLRFRELGGSKFFMTRVGAILAVVRYGWGASLAAFRCLRRVAGEGVLRVSRWVRSGVDTARNATAVADTQYGSRILRCPARQPTDGHPPRPRRAPPASGPTLGANSALSGSPD